MVRTILLFLFIFLFVCLQNISAQTNSIINTTVVTDINSKVLSGLEKQYSSLTAKLNKQSEKLLGKMQQKENKLHAKLNAADSTKAKELFTEDIQQQYANLKSKLSTSTDKLQRFPLKEYLPTIDSVQTTLSFLLKNSNLPLDKIEKVQTLADKLKDLQSQLQKANDIQSFIREREAQLKEQLMNTGLGKQLTAINKDVFYFQMRLTNYKDMLNDKEKLKEKLLETVRTLPAFQKFWQKNSYLAALFPMPANDPALAGQALAGLQTRASVQNLIAQRVGSAAGTGINPQQYFQGQVDAAQAQLNQLKDKLDKFSNESGSSDMTMPEGYNPNSQKTKSLLRRLEFGFNIQSEHGQYGLPTISDLAVTAGYLFSDNKRAGIGLSYKMGWGHGIKDIHFTSEGFGLRSYVDIKSPIKSKGIFFSGLWFSGGFEYNYLSSFKNIQELHNNVDVWQKSALVGLSKKYKVGKKEGTAQLLYDFLSKQQTPPSSGLKFRVGYTF